MSRPSHRERRSFVERWVPVAIFVVLVTAVPLVARLAVVSSSESRADLVSATSVRASASPSVEVGADAEEAAAEVSEADPSTEVAARVKPEIVPGAVIKRDLKALRAARREARLARAAARREREAERLATTPFTVRIGSFNVLGSQHTTPNGPRNNFPPASRRTPAAANVALRHGVDILGTQELQADQLRGMQARTGMAAYPGFAWGEAETDNSILYDAGVFELVSGDRFTITFMGRPRPQPIARFRHKETGREFYVVNTHPSAGGGAYLAQRRRAQGVLVSVVNNLKASGLPVLVTGDMNDRQEFYCHVVPQTGMTAPNGGGYSGGGCQPPPSPLPVDWVVGSGATWSNYWRDTSPVDQRISDHFFISAVAHIGPDAG